MKNNFEISGLFYQNDKYLCRKYLDIKRSNVNIEKPDIMVIMMNPGSSKPEDENDNNTTPAKAVPDNTQDQIMKVMNNCNLNFARVLNLSDVREPKSKIFYSKLQELKTTAHSIFDINREKDFKNLFIKNIPVIFAWGVDKKLEPLALQAIERINEVNLFGLLKKGTISAYYHPLPQNYSEQEKWLYSISDMLKTHLFFESYNIWDITTSSRNEKCFQDFFKDNTIKNNFSFEDKLWNNFCTEWNNNTRIMKIEEYMKRIHNYIEKNNLGSLIRYLSIYDGIGKEFKINPIIIDKNILNNGNHRLLIIRYLIDHLQDNKLLYIVRNPYLSSEDAKKLTLEYNKT